jgi:hypothetical protein
MAKKVAKTTDRDPEIVYEGKIDRYLTKTIDEWNLIIKRTRETGLLGNPRR